MEVLSSCSLIQAQSLPNPPEKMSTLLLGLYFSSLIFCFALSHLLFLLYHLFLKTTMLEESDTIFDFLLMIFSTGLQVSNCIATYFLVVMFINNFQEFNPWFVCLVLNIRQITGTTVFSCIFLIMLIFFFFFVFPDHTKTWNKNVVKNLCTFYLCILPSYVLFVQIMTCGKESFCPPSLQV